jgi:hypothetical protein
MKNYKFSSIMFILPSIKLKQAPRPAAATNAVDIAKAINDAQKRISAVETQI